VPAVALAFALGVWLLQRQAALPSVLWIYALPAAVFGAALVAGMESPGWRRLARVGLPVLACLAGWCIALLWAHLRLADELPREWEGRDVRVTGVIAELPQPSERGMRFAFRVERVLTASAQVPERVMLTWYAERDGGLAALPPLHAGQRWQLTVRLRKPHGTANPHGFDFEVWMLERGIRATGYVRPEPAGRLLQEMVHRPRYWIEHLRERARARIQAALPGQAVAGVLTALAIGDQQAIDAGQWTVFTRTGVNHLMSISGLHITMISGLVFAAALWGWRRLGAVALRFPAQKAAAVAGLAAALAYALLSGFGVPAQRTVTMLACVAAALLAGRAGSPSAVLAFAAILVLALDPWAILAPGFWLSFGAVALILYVSVGRLARPGWLVGWARVQWAVTIGLTPILIALFQQVSVVSPLANAVAIPVVSLGVVPLTLIGLLLPLNALLVLAAELMALCDLLLQYLSALPEAVWQQHAPPRWSLPVAAAGVIWLLAPRGFPARWVGAVALLPLVLVPRERPAPGEAWIDVLDVGQGLAAVVRTANHALLYDAGPAFSREVDSGSRIVVPHLRATGVSRLDGLLITHDDIDHTGGMASVLEALPVAWVASSLPHGDPRLAGVRRRLRCEAGQRWEWDGVDFAVLHPRPEDYNRARGSDNDRSCVLRVAAAGGSVLFTADIERGAERELVERARATLRSDVLVVPHHGSNTSSTDAFLAHVRPGVALFTAGYRNRFGHPAEEVLARYARLGIESYRTDADGALLLRLAPARRLPAWRLWAWRRVQPRYWHGR
jgi:competence protein ComEC